MMLGAALVFGGVMAMNMFSEPLKNGAVDQITSFDVDKKQPPPKPKRKRTERPKPQAKSLARNLAPTPNVASSLSGASFGLPAFEASLDMDNASSVLGENNKNLVMTEDSVDKPAQPVRRVPPEYPSTARKKGIEGHVTLSLLVDEAGSVHDVRLVSAEPPGIFDESAKFAMSQWRFRPAEYQGAPVSFRLKQTIRFQLQ